MSKKNEKWLQKFSESQEVQIQKTVNSFQCNGELVKFMSSSASNPLREVIETVEEEAKTRSWTEERMLEECIKIRDNVKKGVEDNVEINLLNRTQLSNNTKYELGSAIIKIVTLETKTPAYLYLNQGDTVDALIFIGGNNIQAFLLMRDEKGDVICIQLSEFQLLSLKEKKHDADREIGLLTSYLWITRKVYSSVIITMNMMPIKTLILAGYLNQICIQKSVNEEKREDNVDGN